MRQIISFDKSWSCTVLFIERHGIVLLKYFDNCVSIFLYCENNCFPLILSRFIFLRGSFSTYAGVIVLYRKLCYIGGYWS